jgi:predicted dienelactone hydrolase
MQVKQFLALSYFFSIVLVQPSLAQGVNNSVASAKMQKIGMVTKTVTDPARPNWKDTGPRTVTTVIWYPTNSAARDTMIGPFVKLPVVLDAPVAKRSTKYPLVLLSHGAGGTALQLIAWAHYLASRGYIVAAVNHKGDATEEPLEGPFSLADRQMWHRPQDLTAVLNQLLKDPAFRVYIDTSKIAVGGFSLGGYTALAIAGARLSLDQLSAVSSIDSLPPDIRHSIEQYATLLKGDSLLQRSLRHSGDSYKDIRIKGAFALAPAIGEGFKKEGFSTVNIPVYIVVGEKDLIAPKETNAQLYAKGIKGAQLTVLPGEAGHITQPDARADENWLKVFDLSYSFYEQLWRRKKR